MGPKSNDRCPYKKRRGYTEGRRPRVDRGRDWNDAATSPETSGIARSHQTLEETRKDSLLDPSEEVRLSRHLDLAF